MSPKKRLIKRSPRGNIMLILLAFLITSTGVIATVTGFSQFVTVRSKIDGAIVEGEKVAMLHIRDNIIDADITASPAAVQAELAIARTLAINAAVNALGPQIRTYLADRNGGDAANVFNIAATSFVIDSGRLSIQMGAEADVLDGVPFAYTKQTRLQSVLPSEIIIESAGQMLQQLSCNPTNDCGACGICDPTSGKCVANLKVPIQGGDPVTGPFETPGDIELDGTFSCKDFEDTLFGEYCTEELGWTLVNEGGYEGCRDPAPVGFDECEIIPNYSWFVMTNISTFIFTSYSADFHWKGVHVGSIVNDPVGTTLEVGGIEYVRGQRVNFVENPINPSLDVYVLCKNTIKRRVFITSEVFQADLIGYAQSQGLGSFGSGAAAADAICNWRSAAGGLGGSWRAIISDSTISQHGYNIVASTDQLELVDGTPVTDENDTDIWQGPLNDRLIHAIDMNEFGQTLPHSPSSSYPVYYSGQKGVAINKSSAWTATDPYGGGRILDCQGWTSNLPGPETVPLGLNQAAYGVVAPVFAPTVSPSHPLGTGWITYGQLSCDYYRGLYCIEE